MKSRCLARLLTGLMVLASGTTILQTTGCTIDEEVFNEFVNAALESVLDSLVELDN